MKRLISTFLLCALLLIPCDVFAESRFFYAPLSEFNAAAELFGVVDDLDEIVYYLDASKPGTVNITGTTDAVDGDPVGRWEDTAGAGYNATQDATNAKPTYDADGFNGLPGVVFDNVDDHMLWTNGGALNGLRDTGGSTFLIVYKPTIDGTSDVVWQALVSGVFQPRLELRLHSSGLQTRRITGRRLDGDSNDTLTTAELGDDLAVELVTVDWFDGTTRYYRNLDYTTTGSFGTADGATSDTANILMRLGSPTGSGAQMVVNKVLLLKREVSDYEALQLIKGVMAKCNLTF